MSEKIEVFPPGITLFRRESPHIYYYFTINKKSYKGSTHTSNLEDARENARQKYYDVKRQGKEVKKVFKFEKVVDNFLHFKEKRVRERKLGEKTFKEYLRQCGCLVEKFKGKDITSFRKQDFNDYKEWRLAYYTTHKNKRYQTYTRCGKPIKGRENNYKLEVAINRESTLLKSILLFCKNELEFDIKMIPTFDKFDENQGRDILTDDKIGRLKDYWLPLNRYFWDILSFCASTGLRYPSELDRLLWKDVDLENNILIMRNRKGGSRRKDGIRNMGIPLLGEGHEILTRLKARPGILTGDNDFVFLSDTGVKVKNISKSFKASLIKCGITNKHITMYSWRSYFCTKMKNLKMDSLTLSHIMGHSSTQMIERHYAHLLIGDHIDSMQKTLDRKDLQDKARQEIESEKRQNAAMDSWFPWPKD
jgi:integrase